MPDANTEDDFDEAFKGFGDNTPPTAVTPPTGTPPTPPVAPAAAAEEPKVELPKPAEEPKKDEEPAKPKEGEEPPAPTADEKKPEDPAKPPETPETPPTPPAPEESKPLTKDDVESVVSNLLNSERTSGRELETTTKEVLDSYYPEGLSNVLVDEKTQKPLRTPADVVEASGGEMTTEAATQWLMNEQYKLDQSINKIKDDAARVAETTVNFKRDSMTVLQKYDPLFKAYPTLQKKVFDKLMQQVKADEKHGVILSSPDVMEHYDFYLEPYQKAFEFSTGESGTAPTTPATPPAPTPSAEDRLDEAGDGGSGGEVNDPNDFAQQVTKELAKGM